MLALLRELKVHYFAQCVEWPPRYGDGLRVWEWVGGIEGVVRTHGLIGDIMGSKDLTE